MDGTLEERIRELAEEAGAVAVAVAFRDPDGTGGWGVDADRWFHAASTIKLAVLLALYRARDAGRFPADARVHVRNRFTSLADGRYFRVSASRDANDEVHGHVGRTMRLTDLARHMIETSSNLATNVLVELLGIEAIRAELEECGVEGIEFRRGVEDERAWEEGINNRVTAGGLADLLEGIACGDFVTEESSSRMLDVLHGQRFVDGIPAGLPDEARVANKTGEISTVTHDAAVVYLPDREPYVLVILTEWPEDGPAGDRRALVARISKLVLERLQEESHA